MTLALRAWNGDQEERAGRDITTHITHTHTHHTQHTQRTQHAQHEQHAQHTQHIQHTQHTHTHTHAHTRAASQGVIVLALLCFFTRVFCAFLCLAIFENNF